MSRDSYGLPMDNTVTLDNSDMEITPDSNAEQASPATTTSNPRSQSLSHSGGGGGGSHSSYSPVQNTDQIPYRPSPRMTNRIPNQPNQATSTLNNIFYSTSNDMMNANFAYGTTTGGIPSVGGDVDFNMGILGNDWDMGHLSGGATGTGMTPMSEGAWNDLLQHMNMGWDSVGPPHTDFGAQKE
ncbi:uncharacterized protein CC84DRAFT_1160294 [Paraphaeosphaeria sporulosa]|uniref:Uncharacterized protein n=1 Tax=Paraphaeosphaeria sporulosa TaxID=1460663 RepID=A0A177D007_9PLEO|nr:uncharacterized protein CC84DRAFT_1160294 [Paraphaeosphaeria sporulosa]OAG13054.1 hypothetical protein CC84DRAFT_1160294 [Paraphaeosphaeria sporulosa]